MQQERHVVALDFQIALVNVCGKRQRVQLFRVQLRTFGVVNDLAVFAIADARNLAERLSVRVIHHRVIELSARYEIDVLASVQRLLGLDVSVRPDESNLHARVGFLDFPDELDVALQANRGGEQNKKFVVFADLDCLPPVYFVGRCVQQPASRNHACGVRQPNWVPIGFNLACGGPPRARAAVKIFKTRRIQQQCLHYIRHSSPSAFAF